jgi:hypothetical protein
LIIYPPLRRRADTIPASMSRGQMAGHDAGERAARRQAAHIAEEADAP